MLSHPTTGNTVSTSSLKQSIRIGKRNYEVQLKPDEKYGTYILWKNRKYPVEIVRSRQNKYEILFNDISYTFTVETPFSLQRMKVLSKQRENRKRICKGAHARKNNRCAGT